LSSLFVTVCCRYCVLALFFVVVFGWLLFVLVVCCCCFLSLFFVGVFRDYIVCRRGLSSSFLVGVFRGYCLSSLVFVDVLRGN
jgi:hypothetical protein